MGILAISVTGKEQALEGLFEPARPVGIGACEAFECRLEEGARDVASELFDHFARLGVEAIEVGPTKSVRDQSADMVLEAA